MAHKDLGNKAESQKATWPFHCGKIVKPWYLSQFDSVYFKNFMYFPMVMAQLRMNQEVRAKLAKGRG